MKKTIAIAILAVISLGQGLIAASKPSIVDVGMIEAKNIVDEFVNGSLLPSGATATIGDVSEENDLYKMSVVLPDGTNLSTYLTKDGQVFLPEGMNIEEVIKEIAENDLLNNQQSSMELKKEILTEGSGDQEVKSGDDITVHYTGMLEDGTKFDSSLDREEPLSFTIGIGKVIQGWDEGLIGMKVGEERKLTIPSGMAYGPNGQGSIPPNATLIFTIELISID